MPHRVWHNSIVCCVVWLKVHIMANRHIGHKMNMGKLHKPSVELNPCSSITVHKARSFILTLCVAVGVDELGCPAQRTETGVSSTSQCLISIMFLQLEHKFPHHAPTSSGKPSSVNMTRCTTLHTLHQITHKAEHYSQNILTVCKLRLNSSSSFICFAFSFFNWKNPSPTHQTVLCCHRFTPIHFMHMN